MQFEADANEELSEIIREHQELEAEIQSLQEELRQNIGTIHMFCDDNISRLLVLVEAELDEMKTGQSGSRLNRSMEAANIREAEAELRELDDKIAAARLKLEARWFLLICR